MRLIALVPGSIQYIEQGNAPTSKNARRRKKKAAAAKRAAAKEAAAASASNSNMKCWNCGGIGRTVEEALSMRGERGIRVADFNYRKASLELGMLKGNAFVITLR